jgi:hypothetical protein
MPFTRLCGWSLSVLLLGLGLTACDEEDQNPHGGIPLAEAPQEIARAVCPRAYGCCMPSQLVNNDLAGTDQASCEQKTTEGFRNNLEAVRNSQKMGRSVYRGDKLAACLTYIRSSSCQELNRTNHFSGLNCEPYTEPKVPAGGGCSLNFECVGGHCVKEKGAIDGVCVTGEAPPPPTRAQTPTGEMCFYASSCSYGGGSGRPAGAGLVVVVVAASLVGAGMRRKAQRKRQMTAS